MITWDYTAIAAMGLFFLGTYLDFSSSIMQPFYGVGEGNKFLDDANGQFNLKKALIVYALWFAVGVAAWFYHPFATTIWLLMPAVKGIVLGLNNRKQFRYKRNELQTPFLENVQKDLVNGVDTSHWFLKLNTTLRNGRLWFDLFRWVSVPSTEQNIEANKYVLRLHVEALAKQPKSQWFPK